jgi:hypothetical protein
MRGNSWLLVATLLLGYSTSLFADEAKTRTFAAQKCRFTLPGPDWQWLQAKDPTILCLASNGKVVISLSCYPERESISEAFGPGFEKEFLKAGRYTKRSGGFVDYRNSRCYQLVCTLPDNRISYTRVLTANGNGYAFSLVIPDEQTSKEPIFEQAWNGFEFTEPPVPNVPAPMPARANGIPLPPGVDADSAYGRSLQFSYWMGRVLGVCLLAILVLAVVGLFRRRGAREEPKPRKRRTTRDEDSVHEP